MRLSIVFLSAAILALPFPSMVAASDVGVDIPAASYDFESSPDDPFVIADMGSKVGFVRNAIGRTEYWAYEGVDFGQGATHLTVRASSATQGGTLRVHLANHYSSITEVASIQITNTGGWDSFHDFTVPVDPAVIQWLGGRSLFFVVEEDGNTNYKFDVQSFRFDDLSAGSAVNAGTYTGESAPSDDFNIRDLGVGVGYIKSGGWIRFSQFDLGDGATSVKVRASSASNGGTLYVTTQAPFGFGAANLLAVVDIDPTEGWNDFQEFSAEVHDSTSGVVGNLYFSFRGEDGYLYDIESFQFE